MDVWHFEVGPPGQAESVMFRYSLSIELGDPLEGGRRILWVPARS
ncbi:MAG: hypothetical protein AB7L66_19975 [Gemmatimonadales bacterium]